MGNSPNTENNDPSQSANNKLDEEEIQIGSVEKAIENLEKLNLKRDKLFSVLTGSWDFLQRESPKNMKLALKSINFIASSIKTSSDLILNNLEEIVYKHHFSQYAIKIIDFSTEYGAPTSQS